MQQIDIAKFLASLGFKELTLTHMEEAKKTYTYKFSDYNHNKLLKQFGHPDVAANGKVAVFMIPSYGKLGVSPSNKLARLVYKGTHADKAVGDSHLAHQKTTEELALLYERARSNSRYHLTFLDKLWDYFNETKFAGRMHKPRLFLSGRPPNGTPKGILNPRGIYYPEKNHSPGKMWIADYLFKASEIFFNEVVLHEMCHQSVSTLDKHWSMVDGGHGPEWQAWMRKVGLDPRRFDPTDQYAYKDTAEKAEEDDELDRHYGPRMPSNFFKKFKVVKAPTKDEIIMEYKGRAFKGHIEQKLHGYSFRGINMHTNKKAELDFIKATWPDKGVYKE